MLCPRGALSLSVPASSLAWGSSDQSTQRQRVYRGRLVEGRSGGLLSGGDAHSAWLPDLANTVVSRGHSRWCPAYAESEQALLNTTEVTRQQCSVSFGWLPTNDLTSLSVDLWGAGPWCGDVVTSGGCGRKWGCRDERRGSSTSAVHSFYICLSSNIGNQMERSTIPDVLDLC